MPQSFSDRHGYQAPERDISIREDAPLELRQAIIALATRAGVRYSTLRDIVCETLLFLPNPNNWSEVPNVRDEVIWYLNDCEWFKIYDIVEAIYTHLSSYNSDELSLQFSDGLNQFFREQGIGWEMENGKIQYRGLDSFTHAVKGAEKALLSTGRSLAASELAEAVKDISRRPKPDITGAVQHAMAALEATARHVTGQAKPSLGKLISSLDLKPPLDSALEKLWGYASNEARHGREGSMLSVAEAELIVGISGAICSFLATSNN